jgi:PLP dependent protein
MGAFNVIVENLAIVQEKVQQALNNRLNEKFDQTVKLIAVTKNNDIYAMREAIDAGIKVVGENRIQEALDKKKELNRTVEWHLIGHLQTNKVKQAVLNFDLIHSVDSERLAVEINKVANSLNKVQEILVQVNVVNEISKFGLNIEQVNSFIKTISQHENLKVVGLMLIAPYYENPEEARPIFRKLYEQFMEIKNQQILNVEMKWLSMGMTNDYQVAIEEGANIIRVGTGIFGQRKDV